MNLTLHGAPVGTVPARLALFRRFAAVIRYHYRVANWRFRAR